jgi:hypothetical protein
MKRKRIQQVATEQSVTEKLLREKKDDVKHAKGKLNKSNQRRALKVMKKYAQALEDQKEVIRKGGQILVD